MDAITMLKEDHRAVEKLFKSFEKSGAGAYVQKRRIVDNIIEGLSVHAAIEEQLFYPIARTSVPKSDGLVLESLEEHHIVKLVLAELEHMPVEDERFDAKVRVLIENVRHHVKDEEDVFFPKVRDELGRGALVEIGDAMAAARGMASTHPHPHAPDAPPANLVTGAGAGVADRITDTVAGIAEGSVAAVNDIVGRVVGRRNGPRRPSHGSTATRRTAAQVRAAAADATDAVIDATRRAEREGRKATAKAKRATKKTAKKARSSTKRAAATAKNKTAAAKNGARR
jgi:hemerythrin superfamily protein